MKNKVLKVLNNLAYGLLGLSLIGCMPGMVFAQDEEQPALLIELMDEINRLRQELRELRNKNEELEHAMQALQASYQAHFMTHQVQWESTPRKVQRDRPIGETTAESQLPSAATDGQTVQKEDQRPDTAPVDKDKTMVSPIYQDEPLSPEEIRIYQAALERLDNQSLRRDMNHFLERYPDSVLVPGAHYWIAESYYDEQDYQQAARYYDVIIERYPGSRNYNDARLKQAYIHYEKEEWQEARSLFVALSKLNDEKFSPLARSRLANMDQEGL